MDWLEILYLSVKISSVQNLPVYSQFFILFLSIGQFLTSPKALMGEMGKSCISATLLLIQTFEDVF